jgi:hypothetical protein
MLLPLGFSVNKQGNRVCSLENVATCLKGGAAFYCSPFEYLVGFYFDT